MLEVQIQRSSRVVEPRAGGPAGRKQAGRGSQAGGAAHRRGQREGGQRSEHTRMSLRFGVRADTSRRALPQAACPSDRDALQCHRKACQVPAAGVHSGEGHWADCWLLPTKTAEAAGALTGWRLQKTLHKL